ncbi:50S ribosomal protein L29 [Flexilinea flocculi]|jgi:large subunit ribosomal protein L29|uniref:Large ribosomal subunit protein uL29 n=1 Tax=Flexilinea flocculi TaxID=1678840 RepID=A0A0K8PCA7_9CHLR|nr:50S ribosomal protein L29 [Flexilinea flocculi]NMB93281.1 50S ribosomal protein L29 [Flexilinea flocculi]GAP39785.1 LSU ribosomal protein L29P [Flexilinea flocculi]
MKPAEIRILSRKEIVAKLADLRQESMNLRFQVVSGQLTDFSRVKEVRRDIARMETILREMELKSQQEGEA